MTELEQQFLVSEFGNFWLTGKAMTKKAHSAEKCKMKRVTLSSQADSICSFRQVQLVIFRPYFIWERKIFKSNGFFFYKICQAPNLCLTLCLRNMKKYIHRIQLT